MERSRLCHVGVWCKNSGSSDARRRNYAVVEDARQLQQSPSHREIKCAGKLDR